MFLIVWSKEQLDRTIDNLIRLADFCTQRAVDTEFAKPAKAGCALASPPNLPVTEVWRRKSQLASADASSLQIIMRGDTAEVKCAECGNGLLWRQEGAGIAISPHTCPEKQCVSCGGDLYSCDAGIGCKEKSK